MLPTLLFEEHYPPHKKIPLTKYSPHKIFPLTKYYPSPQPSPTRGEGVAPNSD